ncbi:uncharacterized protein LOC125755280 [Canis lupus dingo]|uniref:uncharacterized protein LOC125755280 n=1 Tax=Canis lupus dingo TaxID=286419 RepID=UPI0020C53040|nr:uncharacterized protein LOC125755280 [Canis lupus dingo]
MHHCAKWEKQLIFSLTCDSLINKAWLSGSVCGHPCRKRVSKVANKKQHLDTKIPRRLHMCIDVLGASTSPWRNRKVAGQRQKPNPVERARPTARSRAAARPPRCRGGTDVLGHVPWVTGTRDARCPLGLRYPSSDGAHPLGPTAKVPALRQSAQPWRELYKVCKGGLHPGILTSPPSGKKKKKNLPNNQRFLFIYSWTVPPPTPQSFPMRCSFDNYAVNVKQQKYECYIETGCGPTYKLPASSKHKDSS